MEYDDKHLVCAFQEGDEFAFVSLYNRYKSPVYAFCFKMLLSRDMAEDALQETFLRVYENRERLIKSSSFRSWIFTIARNQCLNVLRRANKHVSIERESEGELRAPEHEGPFSRMEKSEQIELVNDLLAQLKSDYREILILREYHNLSYEEIAAVTRTTVSAVKSKLFKARRKLGNFMSPLMEIEEEAQITAGRMGGQKARPWRRTKISPAATVRPRNC